MYELKRFYLFSIYIPIVSVGKLLKYAVSCFTFFRKLNCRPIANAPLFPLYWVSRYLLFVFFVFLRILALNILKSLDCSHKRKTAWNPIKIRRGQIGLLKITLVMIVSFMTNNRKRITQCMDKWPTFNCQNYLKKTLKNVRNK